MNIEVEKIENLKLKGIYSITNINNNKIYIGSTFKSFIGRFKQHYNKLNQNKHHSLYLQNAWNKYGENNFIFRIVEIINEKDLLLDREKFYIEKYKSFEKGYNLNPNPNTSPMYNDKSRLKSSLTHKKIWAERKQTLSEDEYNNLCKKYVHSYGKIPWNKNIQMLEHQKVNMRTPKKNGISDKMKQTYLNNSLSAYHKADYILVYDNKNNWVNTFYNVRDLVEYSKSEYNNLPIIPSKGKERFGKKLDYFRILKHIKNKTHYKGLLLSRAPKSWKLSYANGMNSWKATQPIMSQAVSTLTEGAETTGEV